MIQKFHYLTQDLPDSTHQELVQIACENGIRWIQLRVKNKPLEVWLQIAKEVKTICDKYRATLIINDNVEIAMAVDAHGVHLGKNDMSVAEARTLLGKSKIIGATANTLEDVQQLQDAGVDYIGLGPYRFTKTKEKLNPVLGIDGYFQIFRFSDFQIPIIAIGGIKLEDVEALMNTGIYGIAVSSAINLALDRPEAINAFLRLV
ncbi:MAG: thiamine phosphate synthase [Chitinophagales bacterium]|jgi:thiamine-phosphate pyrophosphorylase